MGCFDVSCGISSMTIKHGDPALLLLLIPQTDYPDSVDLIKGKVQIETGLSQVFNEGPQGLYMPFCLPIYGKYNDYGSLEELVEDETLKSITKYFNATFKQIVSVIHRGRYGTLHDDEMLEIYGTGLLKGNYSDKAVTEKWIIEAGFVEKDGKFYHPEVSNIIKWKDGKIEKTEEPKAYVEFKVPFKGSNEKKIMPHIIYWEDDKWNETWQREQKGFCESFMEHSKPMGWFSSKEHGVVLGIKEEFVKKAVLLRKLSGMFIDGKFYKAFTGQVKTNSYYAENGAAIMNSYMNKYLMDLLGFTHEGFINDETKSPFDPEDKESKYKMAYLYSHKDAPGFKFSVRSSRSMVTDMYKVDGTKLKEIKEGKYHPFHPKGLAAMFEGKTGNKLDVSGLDNITAFDITLLKIQDLIKQRESNKLLQEDLRKQLDVFSKEDESPEKTKLLNKYFSLIDRSESRENGKEALGSFNFPLVYDFYEEAFANPTKKFKDTCSRFKNFMVSLWGINRLLMPSSHFGQHGEYINQIEFNNIISKVLKDKMLSGYGSEFTSRAELDNTLKLLYGKTKATVSGKKGKSEIKFSDDSDKEVAVWNDEEEYGYLITKKGM